VGGGATAQRGGCARVEGKLREPCACLVALPRPGGNLRWGVWSVGLGDVRPAARVGGRSVRQVERIRSDSPPSRPSPAGAGEGDKRASLRCAGIATTSHPRGHRGSTAWALRLASTRGRCASLPRGRALGFTREHCAWLPHRQPVSLQRMGIAHCLNARQHASLSRVNRASLPRVYRASLPRGQRAWLPAARLAPAGSAPCTRGKRALLSWVRGSTSAASKGGTRPHPSTKVRRIPLRPLLR
jgi:hypothetical protein